MMISSKKSKKYVDTYSAVFQESFSFCPQVSIENKKNDAKVMLLSYYGWLQYMCHK